MENKILISVIIPIYNSEKFLEKSIEGVLSQSLKSIEVICINDGSTDSSKTILERIMNLDSRIILINKKNEGQGSARNLGLSVAKGEYVAFFDPDDLYANKYVLENLYKVGKLNDADICGGNIECFYDNAQETFLLDEYIKYHIHTNGFVKYEDYQNVWAHVKYIFKNSFLINNNIEYPKYRRGEDPVFMMEAIIKAKNIYLISDTVYLYRQYRNRPKFANQIIMELMEGYGRTMSLAIKNNLIEPFLDCMGQIKYWYYYIGFGEWENEAFWNLISYLKLLMKEGSNKWELPIISDENMSKEKMIEKIDDYVEKILLLRELCMKEKVVIYGMGKVASDIMGLLSQCDIRPYKVITTDKPSVQTFWGVETCEFGELANKRDCYYLVCVSNKIYRNEIIDGIKKEECNKILNLDTEELSYMEGLAGIITDRVKHMSVNG